MRAPEERFVRERSRRIVRLAVDRCLLSVCCRSKIPSFDGRFNAAGDRPQEFFRGYPRKLPTGFDHFASASNSVRSPPNEASIPERRTMRFMNRLASVALVALVCPLGCSGRAAGSTSKELPPECDAFVAKYESCVQAAVPALPAVAKQRAAQTRASLEQEAQRATTANRPENLAALATKCQDNLQRLASSCGTTRTN
jgi:hypothetical protein